MSHAQEGTAVNNHRITCDPTRIDRFLERNLSDEEQTAFESHLDDCDDCRRRLEAAAAGEEIWSDILDSLRDEQPPPDGSRSDDFSLDSSAGGDAAFSYATVLKLLAPTDDDRMLGRVGPYEVAGVVGSGGMGVVLKAFDPALNRSVAIKVLAPHLGGSGAARRRFSREAQAAAAVVHDNVIEIYGVDDVEGLPYLVMPYVRGPSLQRRLDDEGPLALVEILRIGMQAAAGLAAAHAQGLVHRDVTPANILLADGVERVKLTDFGLARAADDARVTRTGVIAGTPQYMSPEQARGESVDPRSDLFSLGSVLYAMCTGRPPFRAETSYGVLRRITDEEPRPIREINPDIPEWLCAIIARLMAKRPENRFASAGEAAELLETCLAHVQQPTVVSLPHSRLSLRESSASSPFALRKGATFAERKATLRRRSLGVIVMLAMLVPGLLGMVLWQATEAPDIAGAWTGDEWGTVALEATRPGQYEGTYTGDGDGKAGAVQLTWSRLERRFNGAWREGEDRFGELSVRLAGDEIRGAFTTDPQSKTEPGAPRLADLTWTRPGSPAESRRDTSGALSHRVPFEVGAVLLRGGDRITIDEVRGTADTIQEGNMYEIRGTYRLASQDKATLAVYVTEDGTPEPTPPQRETPTQRTQSIAVERGEGTFALILYVWRKGKPHVSFYPESGEGIGHVYFGTGDSVLRKGWWKSSPNNEAPPPKAPSAAPLCVHHFTNLTTGNEVRVAVSADGKRVAVANGNPTLVMHGGGRSEVKDNWKPSVKILDAEAGKVVVSLAMTTAEEDAVLAATERISHVEATALAFSPDGSVLAVGTNIGQVKLFDAQTGELVRSLDDEAAKLADNETPENWKSLRRAMGSVASLAFSPDGALLATCGGSFADFAERFGGVERLGFRTTGPGRLKVWNVQAGTLKHDLAGHNDHAYAVAFSPDGSLLASAGRWHDKGDPFGNGVIVWNPRTGKQVHRLIRTTANAGVRSIAFSPDGQRLALGTQRFGDGEDSSTGGVSLVEVSSGIEHWLVTVPGWAKPVTFSPDGASIVVLCAGKSIRFLEAAMGTMEHEIRPAPAPQAVQWKDVAIAQQGHTLAIGGMDQEKIGSIEVWSLNRAKDGQGVPTAPREQPLPDTSPGTALRYSEPQEVVLAMGSIQFMLDFDTGQTMDPPARPRPEQARMDVRTTQVQPYHYPTGLIGLELQGVEVKASDWDASPAEVRRVLASDRVHPLKQMDTGPEANPTYFFKTRDGAEGVLQLLGLVDEPKGVRIRYKTLQAVIR